MKRFLIILFSIACLQTNAQNLVTPITINLPANLPANIADWATAMPPVMILAQTKMENGYINGYVMDSKILVTIKSGGGKACGTFTAQTAPQSNFTTVAKNWTGAAVVELLGQNCILKPGSYEFCVQFYSIGSAAAQPRILGEACKPFVIKDEGKETYSPPVNVSPANGKSITEKEAKAPLTFRWTPVIPKPQKPVQYKLRVWQLMQGQTATQAIKANTPIVEKDIKDITQFVKPNLMGDVEMLNGTANLVWNVQALSDDGKAYGLNNGFSDATQFSVSTFTCLCNGLGATSFASVGYVPAGGVIDAATMGWWHAPMPLASVSTITLTQGMASGILYPVYYCTNSITHPSTSCPPGATAFIYSISDGVSTTVLPGFGLSFNLNNSAINILPCGNYTLSIIALCNGMPCTPFTIPIVISGCNPPDCCLNSTWGTKEIVSTLAHAGRVLPGCGTNIGLLDCNRTYPLKVCYNCNSDCQGATAQIKYEIFNGSVLISSTTVASCSIANITTPSVTGNYSLVITAFCGGNVCNTCTYYFKTECQQNPIECCKGGKWLNKYYQVSTPLIHPLPVKIACDSIYEIDYIPNGSITFNADYLCNPLLGNCNKQVLVSVKKPGTSLNILQPVSYSLPLSEPGVYKICYIAICGTDTCDKCCFTIVIKEKKDCCKGSFWINKSIDWSNIIDKNPAPNLKALPSGPITPLPNKSSISLECNKSYNLGLGGTYTFNADYNCPEGCTKNVKVKIEGLANNSLDGIYNAPIAKTFVKDGTYKITYLAYCGNEICDSCVFYVGIDKNCCLNSKWISADYQIVNKKADGSWDWMPGINPIGNSIPTLKADLGIDISNLSFECAKGCTAGYIVRRINQSTGGLAEPDETLAPGQTTTSIYSKPYPQTIVITPTCDGQKCTPLIFRVECLNKNCVPPPLPPCNNCDDSGNLVVNGDFESGNTGFTSSLTYSTGAMNADKYFVNGGTYYPSIYSKTGLGNYFSIQAYYNHMNELSGKVFWKNSIPYVTKVGSKYAFCFDSYLSYQTENMSLATMTPGNPNLEVEVLVNGLIISSYVLGTGSHTVIPSTYWLFPWLTKNFNWVATSSSAIVELKFKSKTYPQAAHWNFGLDDIKLKECSDILIGNGNIGSSSASGQLGHIDGVNIIEATNCNLTIGQSYQGGKIAYILQPIDAGYDPNVCHGLISAPNDGPYLEWGCNGSIIGTSQLYGSGMTNTLAIVTACPSNTIAKYCNDLVLSGYSDWHLPSQLELEKLFLSKNLIGLFPSYYYASSTEYLGYAFFVGGYFNNLSTTYLQGTTGKGCCNNVRAVRYF